MLHITQVLELLVGGYTLHNARKVVVGMLSGTTHLKPISSLNTYPQLRNVLLSGT